MKEGFKITEIHGLISVDEEGTEGIVGTRAPDGQWMPFITADKERLELVLPMAKEISKASGKKISLRRWTNMETIQEDILSEG